MEDTTSLEREMNGLGTASRKRSTFPSFVPLGKGNDHKSEGEWMAVSKTTEGLDRSLFSLSVSPSLFLLPWSLLIAFADF